jgi:hypothetical protein
MQTQPKPMPLLLASAPSLERLANLVRRYFGDPRILVLHEDGSIETANGVSPSHRWRHKGKRYRFELA